ncbi:hypothetical protein B0I35DRAFT_442075 [Stachybotrys elegans]|uniref:Uncharacterized protein n=1 Tax=Stachybotrys elegans TaxID=80388 RepID=A0A8K0SHS6_9HYPO|nr:hypothetical protein B0I35DRAFT_442075 [Stachybotrys elegans]
MPTPTWPLFQSAESFDCILVSASFCRLCTGHSFTHSTSSDASLRFSPPSSPDRNLSPSTAANSGSQSRPSSIDNKRITMLARARSPSARAGALGVLMSNAPAPLERTINPQETAHSSLQGASNPHACCGHLLSLTINPSFRRHTAHARLSGSPSHPSQPRGLPRLYLLPAIKSSQQSHPATLREKTCTNHSLQPTSEPLHPGHAHCACPVSAAPIRSSSSTLCYFQRLMHAMAPQSPKRSRNSDPFDEDTRDSKRRKMARRE